MKNIKQKICGVIEIIASVISIWILKDATLAILAIPFGLFLMFTKQNLD